MDKLAQRNSVFSKIKYNLNRDLNWCQNHFLLKDSSTNNVGQGGISCLKYNYSNQQSKNVKIWFNNMFDRFYYKGDKDFVRKTVKISEIKGLIFGPFSSTF